MSAMFFDKERAVDAGEFRVVEITTRQGVGADDALAPAAAVGRDFEHTLAEAS